jgi:glycosyltransferase involved in cell wall biosynthesis
MASELPYMVTRVGGAAELILEGVNGYTVPPHNPEAIAEGWYKVLQNKDSFSSEETLHYIKQKLTLINAHSHILI